MKQIFRIDQSGVTALDAMEPGCWVNLIAPDSKELASVSQELGIPMDMLTAALDQEELARIESEDGITLVTADIPMIEEENGQTVYSTLPFGIIHKQDYIVTVCLTTNTLTQDFIQGRVRNVNSAKKTRFIFQLLYRNATRFLMYLRQIDKSSDRLHLELQKSYRNKELLQMMALEKSLVYFSTSIKSNEMVLEKLIKVNYIPKFPEDEDLLEDAIVENKQAMEMCAIYSDILSSMMDAYASIISNNLNIVMKVLAAITIIMSVPTLVASLWGINVPVPWSNNPYGFWLVLGLSVVLSVGAAIFMFKRKMF